MTIKMLSTRFTPVCLLLSLAACASSTPSRVGSAASTPLNDLNIVRADIPAVLEEALKQPYLVPADRSCAALSLAVRKLDEALGADLDVPASANAHTLIERGADAAGDSAMGALQRTAEGIIPFRSWVRKLTGAERYSKHVAAAIAAGSIRRAFLKGIGSAQACAWDKPAQMTAASHPSP